MLGKASEIEMVIFEGTKEYRTWRLSCSDCEIIDVKFAIVPVNSATRILVVYKKPEERKEKGVIVGD